MDVQTIEQRLEDLDYQRVAVPAWEEQLARLRSGAMGSRAEGRDGARGTAEQDRMAGAISHMEQIERLIKDRKPELDMLIRWAQGEFDKLPMAKRDPLTMHYIGGSTWPLVADAMHYSEDNCKKVRRKAIRLMAR